VIVSYFFAQPVYYVLKANRNHRKSIHGSGLKNMLGQAYQSCTSSSC